MIEPLLLEGYEDGMIVCKYFPPHVQFASESMGISADRLLILPENTYPLEQFGAVEALQVMADNGGAVYFLYEPDEQGLREGKLWKLIPFA